MLENQVIMDETEGSSTLNRRDFLRIATAMGGAAAMAAFLEACSQAGVGHEGLLLPTETRMPPTPTPNVGLTVDPTSGAEQEQPTEPIPSATPTDDGNYGVVKIALVKTQDRAAGVGEAIELLGINSFAGKRIFLKPNFNSADPAPGSTHPQTLVALVTALKGMGAGKITVGDRSGMGDTRQVMQAIGVFELAQEYGFSTVVFDDLGAGDWVLVQPPGAHWRRGFPMARACLEAEAVVQTCCLKTHRYGGHFTMSLKNSVGMVAKRSMDDGYDFMDELHSSPHQRRMIAEINSAYTPKLIVMDGVEAFISGGPDQGERVSAEVILAGTDRIALDAAGVAVLRYFGCQTEASQGKIFEQEQIARAVDLGLGVDGPEKIEFLTGDGESADYAAQIRRILVAG
jgi:uncharacterized protein (DUF362 family)